MRTILHMVVMVHLPHVRHTNHQAEQLPLHRTTRPNLGGMHTPKQEVLLETTPLPCLTFTVRQQEDLRRSMDIRIENQCGSPVIPEVEVITTTPRITMRTISDTIQGTVCRNRRDTENANGITVCVIGIILRKMLTGIITANVTGPENTSTMTERVMAREGLDVIGNKTEIDITIVIAIGIVTAIGIVIAIGIMIGTAPHESGANIGSRGVWWR